MPTDRTCVGVAVAVPCTCRGGDGHADGGDNDDGDATLDTYKYTSVGAAYTIATGITAKLAITEGDIQNNDDEETMDSYNTTRLSVSVAF